MSKAEIADVSDISPIQQIKNIAVTVADENGNENKQVKCASSMPSPMPRGIADPDFHVDVRQSGIAWPGTTLLPDNHNRDKPGIIEVNMLGEIVWEPALKDMTFSGIDAAGLGFYKADRISTQR